jgi:hypothetical protein
VKCKCQIEKDEFKEVIDFVRALDNTDMGEKVNRLMCKYRVGKTCFNCEHRSDLKHDCLDYLCKRHKFTVDVSGVCKDWS